MSQYRESARPYNVEYYLDAILKTQLEPIGSFWDRWLPRWCTHASTRCVHGDEIRSRNSRVVCRLCGRSLRDRTPPRLCFYTGKTHREAATK